MDRPGPVTPARRVRRARRRDVVAARPGTSGAPRSVVGPLRPVRHRHAARRRRARCASAASWRWWPYQCLAFALPTIGFYDGWRNVKADLGDSALAEVFSPLAVAVIEAGLVLGLTTAVSLMIQSQFDRWRSLAGRILIPGSAPWNRSWIVPPPLRSGTGRPAMPRTVTTGASDRNPTTWMTWTHTRHAAFDGVTVGPRRTRSRRRPGPPSPRARYSTNSSTPRLAGRRRRPGTSGIEDPS